MFSEYQTLRKKWCFPIRDFFRKCDQICRKLRIWSHLLKKSLMENFIFCTVVFMYTCNDPPPKRRKMFMYRCVTLTCFYQKSSKVCFPHPWVKWRHLYNKWGSTVKVSWTIINHSEIKMFPPQIKTTVSTKVLFFTCLAKLYPREIYLIWKHAEWLLCFIKQEAHPQ